MQNDLARKESGHTPGHAAILINVYNWIVKQIVTSLTRDTRLRNTDFPVFAFPSHSIIPQFPFSSWCDISSSNHEITKVLAFVAFERISLDHGLEDGQDLGFRHGFTIYLVEPLTMVSTTEKHRVAAWSLPDERHLCET